MPRRLAAALALTAALVAPLGTSAQAAPVVGMGHPPAMALSDLTDSLFMPLGINTVRVVVPWNVVETDPLLLEQWADAVRDIGIDPLVAFGASRNDRCPYAPCSLPSDAEYVADFKLLRSLYPWLRTFTPWNEPNHMSQPTAGAPAAAAHYADLLADACPDCRIVAGDLLDAPGMLGYLGSYQGALHITPSAWALHNYYDTTYFDDQGTTDFLDSVPGPVWITETGGIVTWRTADGSVQMPYDEQRAAQSVEFALGLAAAHADRIERVFIYQWRAGADDRFDAGLVRPDGSPRPALDVLRRALQPMVAPGAGGGNDGADAGAADGAPAGVILRPDFAVRAKGRATLGAFRVNRRGRLSTTIRCGGSPCRGTVTVAGAGAIAERLVNGHVQPGTLAARRIHVTLRAGASQRLSLRLPARVLRRAARIGRLQLTVSLVSDVSGDFLASRRRVTLRVGRAHTPRRPARQPR